MEGGEKCKSTGHKVVNGKTVMTDEPSPIYLIQKNGAADSTCNRLALDFTNSQHSSISLYDREDPAMGVSLKLLEGDYCCPTGVSCADGEWKQRTFTFELRCADAVNTFPDTVSVDTVNNGCDYTVTLRTIHACPASREGEGALGVGCPRIDNNVCGMHGVCGYDEVARTARCYCGSKYTGTDCQKFHYKSLLSADALVIALTVILTAVVICTIFFVWNKLRKISVNPDAFDNLESKFNELGQMTY